MFLDLAQYVIRNVVAYFRLRVHTLRCETVTWNPRSSPACDLCEAEDDVQDEQHIIFHCTHPHVVSLLEICVLILRDKTNLIFLVLALL